MKPTQQHTEQIRKMAEREYCTVPFTRTIEAIQSAINEVPEKGAYIKGGIAVMESLDISDDALDEIITDFVSRRIMFNEAKQQILNAITIKEKP